MRKTALAFGTAAMALLAGMAAVQAATPKDGLVMADRFLKYDYVAMLTELEPHAETLPRLKTVIHVGAATEAEMKERKARVDDALHATRAAIEEGVVPGGGVALLRCLPALSKLALEGDEAIGVDIVRRAIASPIRMLCSNAGVEGSVIANRVAAGKGGFGYNVATGEFEDLVKCGVVDPTKVTRSALQNAASIAGLLLATECIITEAGEGEPSIPV